jgi:hypothetical protein
MTIRDVHFQMYSSMVNRDQVCSMAMEIRGVRLVHPILNMIFFESVLTFTKLPEYFALYIGVQ